LEPCRRRVGDTAEERRPALSAKDRALTARLAEGAVGARFHLTWTPRASRQDALVILRNALRDPDYSQLFHATETYRAGADGQEKNREPAARSR